MKVFATAALLVAVSSVAVGDFVANNFMDRVLTDVRNAVISQHLEPALASQFGVLVKGNGITNKDFKANFTRGSITGLSNILRWGECNYGAFGNNMKLGCNVALNQIRGLFNADVQGDSISNNKHSISTSSDVASNTYALIEIQGPRGFAARLDRITVRSITLTTKVIQGKIDLNSSRFTDAVKQINANVASQINYYLTGPYSQVLAQVLSRYSMP